MQVTIQPSQLSGTITAPASKSSMQRACAAALVRKGESIIRNPGISNDDKAALKVIQALGATVAQQEDGSIKITSNGVNAISTEVSNGESGLGIRMFAPLVAINAKEMTINGEGSLLTRPMDFFDEIFPQLGITITSNGGKLPLKVKGPLQPKNITIDGSLSSQFLTGLLLAYAALDAKDVTITVDNLKSKPYVDLTLSVMEQFQLKVPRNTDHKAFYFDAEPANYQSTFIDYTVESDWSGGAFLLVAGAICGNITVKGLDIASTQADKAVMQALIDCGAAMTIKDNEIVFAEAARLKPFHFDATDCPDLFPPLAALAAYCDGTTTIKGVLRLAHKESDRGLTIQQEMGKMGLPAELDGDEMQIHGGKGLHGAGVHSRHDHRIAMMCAIAGLKADGETVIDEAQAVSKSYPNFYGHIQSLGAKVSSNQVIN
ncbi:3-phosphoshikimate 1-carboxyvinyltransferase [Panacibacter sp. DH6]|uniref:3-phosphoshikimate 1-carboxyvinyltransferase n=1 Tax=Panacibacter microcysteis TaxID=2793269 RepID=A0A931DZJ8_9BACT|nr:3-phosphoshikimate 1-carboxyvinyltransferase [Panacibacter microcysteis]MBG9374670.1 3-phosphoshikimate 1-carboxyvinyltransferase [Panacibacter microcysteis]